MKDARLLSAAEHVSVITFCMSPSNQFALSSWLSIGVAALSFHAEGKNLKEVSARSTAACVQQTGTLGAATAPSGSIAFYAGTSNLGAATQDGAGHAVITTLQTYRANPLGPRGLDVAPISLSATRCNAYYGDATCWKLMC